MPAAALALVLAGALLHALWNIAAKKAGGDARFTFFSGAIMAVFWAPLALWVGWTVVPQWGWREWLVVAFSALLHWVYFVCLLTGYRKSDLTVVYPMARGSGPVLSSGVAVVLFGEQLSALGILGIGGVAFGVFLIAGGPGLWRAAHDPHQRARVHAGIYWGLLTGALIACYTVLDACAVKALALSPIVYDYFCNLLRLPFAAIPALRDLDEARALWRRQWRHAVVVGILSPAAYVCVLFAIQMAPVSHVAPAREVSMLFAALLGGQLLGEGDRWLRFVGAGCIAAGVAALALG